MRLANVDGRALLLTSDDTGVDVGTASGDRFGPGLPGIYDDWDAFRQWADTLPDDLPTMGFTRTELAPPSPRPRQIFAVGLNYREHAEETGLAVPEGLPPVFTKFASSLGNPDCTVSLPAGGNTDWEVELVAIIGRRASHLTAAQAWESVAGLTVGQDISERASQFAGPVPQFGLAKSFPNFAPTGPWLVTPDAVGDPDDLEIGCAIDGEVVQHARTSDLLIPVAEIIARLSATVTLYPGDLVFTGTPAGVGYGRTPARYLRPGERLRTWIEGIGELDQLFV
ncbi:fumarylacetoacetate hydrolase family protein [Gordonia sp. NPDC003376]